MNDYATNWEVYSRSHSLKIKSRVANSGVVSFFMIEFVFISMICAMSLCECRIWNNV